MSDAAEEFTRRRTALQMQCALQREQLAQSIAGMEAGFSFVNRGVGVMRSTRLLPMILAALSAAGVLSRAGGAVRLVGRVWLIINTLQRLRRSLK
jgi:hypothetical protein